ncbi:MAG: inositol monophosphatase [Acidimicrobiia bacterium]|nr:inositol monophosphatase [Acidimicrobiia bacterium]
MTSPLAGSHRGLDRVGRRSAGENAVTEDLDIAVDAARIAGQIILDAFGRPVGTDWKGAVDPVTEVDRAAERAILTLLKKARPSDAILAEESGSNGDGARRWIVDPIDGTVNFIHGIPHIAVSVALWEGLEPLVSAVLDVTRDELFTAAAGSGVFLNGHAIAVSSTTDAGSAICATGFPYDRRDRAHELAAQVERMLTRTRALRRMGSAAIDLAWVAAGRYDGFWEASLPAWDSAAGLLLVREAGGTVTRLDRSPLNLETGSVIASNGSLHETLAGIINGDA